MTKKYSSSHPDPIDKHVGANIRRLRTFMGLSQEKMADALGITFQQIQKYENGTNRVGASRLYNIANILSTPVDRLFDGIEEDKATLKAAEEKTNTGPDLLSKRESINLLRNYYAIEDEEVRKKIQDMIKSFAQQTNEGQA